ncbi:hypothetical protein EW146_g8769, partial [Bondarzewia mesenterica]
MSRRKHADHVFRRGVVRAVCIKLEFEEQTRCFVVPVEHVRVDNRVRDISDTVDSAQFEHPARFSLSDDSDPLGVSHKKTHHSPPIVFSGYEKDLATRVDHLKLDVGVSLDHLEMSKAERPSTKTKIYEFLSRSTSRSRSRSQSASGRAVSNDTDPSQGRPSPPAPPTNSAPSRPYTRSPSRPLSANTTNTEQTVTQTNVRARTPRSRPAPVVVQNPAEYDSRMPILASPQPQKKKSPTLFGISFTGRSRPSTPKQEDLTSPPRSPTRGRQGELRMRDKTKLEQWFSPRLFSVPARLPNETAASSSLHPPVHAPQPHRAVPHIMSAPSTPVISAVPAPADSDRDGQCSPLRRMLGVKPKERTKDKPVVSVPMLRTRTYSRDGAGGGGPSRA